MKNAIFIVTLSGGMGCATHCLLDWTLKKTLPPSAYWLLQESVSETMTPLANALSELGKHPCDMGQDFNRRSEIAFRKSMRLK